jgi:peptide/nickel transport system substrate-binding protein
MQATMPEPAAGSYLVSVLRQIGYRASLRAIASPQTYWNTVGNSRNQIQVGEFRWSEDYPAPWDFFGPLFSCHSFIPGKSRQPERQPVLQSPGRRSVPAGPRHPGRLSRHRQAALGGHRPGNRQPGPWVPLYNPRALIVLSARVGNYQFHPLWKLLIDQLWIR